MGQEVIKLLNEARARELLAISQYMVQHYELEDAGYGKLADKIKAIAIVEMKHAEDLAERILFLKGEPVTKPDSSTQAGLSIPDLLKVDIKLEDEAVKMYNSSARACAELGDHVSKTLFESLLVEEEEHLDDFQKILEHVEQLGNVYLSSLLE